MTPALPLRRSTATGWRLDCAIWQKTTSAPRRSSCPTVPSPRITHRRRSSTLSCMSTSLPTSRNLAVSSNRSASRCEMTRRRSIGTKVSTGMTSTASTAKPDGPVRRLAAKVTRASAPLGSHAAARAACIGRPAFDGLPRQDHAQIALRTSCRAPTGSPPLTISCHLALPKRTIQDGPARRSVTCRGGRTQITPRSPQIVLLEPFPFYPLIEATAPLIIVRRKLLCDGSSFHVALFLATQARACRISPRSKRCTRRKLRMAEV